VAEDRRPVRFHAHHGDLRLRHLHEHRRKRARLAPAFFLSGVVFFSGSLYAMAFGAPRWLGAITPIGGVLFLIGWAILAWAARDVDQPAA